jgi:hypothetical protein
LVVGVIGGWAFLALTGFGWKDVLALWQLVGELQYGGSTGVRLNLVRNGWEMILGTGGAGVGAGGFPSAITHGFGRFNTAGIVNPHNYWLEIGAQYGVIVLAGVIFVVTWWMILLMRNLRLARLRGDRPGIALAATGLSGLAAYVIGAGANSTFIPQPTNWTFLGTLGGIVATGVVHAAGTRGD